MKKLIKQYTFNPSERTITFDSITGYDFEQLLLISDVTSGKIIYNFAGSSSLTGVKSGDNGIFLNTGVSELDSGDRFQIWMDLESQEAFSDVPDPIESGHAFVNPYFDERGRQVIKGYNSYLGGLDVNINNPVDVESFRYTFLNNQSLSTTTDAQNIDGFNTVSLQVNAAGTPTGRISILGNIGAESDSYSVLRNIDFPERDGLSTDEAIFSENIILDNIKVQLTTGTSGVINGSFSAKMKAGR